MCPTSPPLHHGCRRQPPAHVLEWIVFVVCQLCCSLWRDGLWQWFNRNVPLVCTHWGLSSIAGEGRKTTDRLSEWRTLPPLAVKYPRGGETTFRYHWRSGPRWFIFCWIYVITTKHYRLTRVSKINYLKVIYSRVYWIDLKYDQTDILSKKRKWYQNEHHWKKIWERFWCAIQ